MDKLLVEKYKPKKLDDFVISSKNLKSVKKWITELKKNVLILHGPPGIGKTSLAYAILNEYGYDIIEFNTSDMRNQKLIKEELRQIFNKNNILSIMNKKTKKIGIIMDELDGISGSGEKSGLTEFINLINPKKNKFYNPIICTTNHINDKKVREISKLSETIKITSPKFNDMMVIIDKIEKGENFKINDNIKTQIISKSQFDIRRLINIIEYVINSNFSEGDLNILIDKFEKKNVDVYIFDSVQKIMNNYNFNDIMSLYNSDKNIISLLMYENFLSEIVHNKKDKFKKKISNISKIYENFSSSDIMDYKIMINNQRDLGVYSGIEKCVQSSFILNDMKKYSFKKKNDIGFSQLLNKTSLEYLNYKYLNDILLKFDFKCSLDIHTDFCDLIVKMISNNPKNGIELLKNYNYDLNKIDKIVKNCSNPADYKHLSSKEFKKKIFD